MQTKEISYEIKFLDYFIIPFLEKEGFSKIRKEQKIDIVAEKNNKIYCFETIAFKQYRSYYNIDLHIQRLMFLNQNDKDKQYYLICLGNLSETQKADNYNIKILDLSNLLYLCKNDFGLIEVLKSLVDYSFDKIAPYSKNISVNDFDVINQSDDPIEEILTLGNEIVENINNCESGKNYATKYESVCIKFIQYLFNNYLNEGQSQSKTNNGLYKIDYIAKIKDNSQGFWNNLVRFFNTKYIVFEFKNYAKHIEQNNIYVTEKYLYSTALRNVAIIISRKGFSKKETNIAAGILKEHGKLILGLSDQDLIEMIRIKQRGESPSDYLQAKMDKFLLELTK